MDFKYPTLWSKEYIDKVAPRVKTRREKKKEYEKRIMLEKVVLSNKENELYNLPLIKEELINAINYHNAQCEAKFLDSKMGLFDVVSYHASIFNPGVPQMLLTSLSQYSKKNQDELMISDLIIMYHSFFKVLKDEQIKGDNFSKFRNENAMSFFGYKQFLLMDEYAKSLGAII